MKKLVIYAVLLLLGAIFTSCRTTAILSTNFESAMVGTLPAKDLPGAPTGDEMTFSSELEPRIRVVSSGSNKALSFTEINTPGLTEHNQFLGFKGIPTNFTQPLWFFYTATHSGSGEAITIDITDGSAGMIARFHLTDSGDLKVLRDFGSNPQLIGNIPPGVSHTFVLRLNMSDKKCHLSVLKSGGNITVENIGILGGDPLIYVNPANPTISFRYDDGASATRKYVIEAIGINKKAP